MIRYTTEPTDTINNILFRYQTSKAILEADNPGVNFSNIPPGTILQIRTTTEYAAGMAASAVGTQKISNTFKQNIQLPQKILADDPVEPIMVAGVTIDNAAQKGVVKWATAGAIYQLTTDGRLVEKEKVEAGSRYKYYGKMDAHGGLYVLGGTNMYAKVNETNVETVAQALYTVGSSTPSVAVGGQMPALSIPQFQEPGYKRTRLKVKNESGVYETVELRVTSFVPTYGTQLAPSRTNAGWMTAVGGANLLPITIGGFWLDTVGNPEARDFMNFFKKYLVPKNDVDYFSAEVVTLLHKSWEYKGLIQNFTMTEQVETPLDRKFQMQFLAFKDAPISRSAQNEQFRDVVKRDGADSRQGELNFRSDIAKMLTSPITGTYMTDND